jgi:hypothetical protein
MKCELQFSHYFQGNKQIEAHTCKTHGGIVYKDSSGNRYKLNQSTNHYSAWKKEKEAYRQIT